MENRGLPWGVQWEVARLVSRGYCTWKNIELCDLDLLREEGSRDSESPLNEPIAPYIEDIFRRDKKDRFERNKEEFGHQRPSKEARATVCYNVTALPYNLITDHCRCSHLGLSWTERTWPSRTIATPAS